MVRSILAPALAAAALMSALPAFAQAPSYRAVPAAPVTVAQNVIAGETLWKCSADGCTTAAATARPAILCAQTVKKIGRISSFVVNGVAFAADDLAKCNAKAKDGQTALARN